jgi:hypothetical protein
MKEKLIILDEVNHKKALDFFNVYECENIIDIGEFARKAFWGKTSSRKCRFCRKSEDQTTFKKKAHIVPQLIGNRHLLSAFECDVCNKLFGDLYENSFANFIGAFRLFSNVVTSKNNPNPKYKEVGQDKNQTKKIKLQIEKYTDKELKIFYEEPFSDAIVFDKERKSFSINATRQPYVPLYVYKMLLKMALSFISEDEVENYIQPLAFLIDNSQNDKFKKFPLCRVYMHTLFGGQFFKTPLMYLYKKKDEDVNCPSKTFVLFTGNHVYQIFIPLVNSDLWMHGNKVRLFPYPLLFDKSKYQNGLSYKSFGIMLDSNEARINEPQKLIFSYQDANFDII